ncbi:MAG: tetratricopeptide repeat protein [Sandaracinaceae bacterium]|nr:tetratricopeptide repeat protein [Sandaracinaceae bacterium]
MSERLRMIEAMIEKGSKDPFHHYARAMELRGLERHAEALDAFAEVRDRFPDYVPTYLMAAQLAKDIGSIEEAARWADDGIAKAREKGDSHSLSELLQFRELLGRTDDG